MFHEIDMNLYHSILGNQPVYATYFAEDIQVLCFFLSTAEESDLDSIRKALG